MYCNNECNFLHRVTVNFSFRVLLLFSIRDSYGVFTLPNTETDTETNKFTQNPMTICVHVCLSIFYGLLYRSRSRTVWTHHYALPLFNSAYKLVNSQMVHRRKSHLTALKSTPVYTHEAILPFSISFCSFRLLTQRYESSRRCSTTNNLSKVIKLRSWFHQQWSKQIDCKL